MIRLALVLLTVAAVPVFAQPADTLGTVEVTAAAPYRLSTATAPLALAARTRTAAEIATEPGLSLDAALAGLPGVWVSNRESRAQGERLLVRGLGWRAAFGVRGTHVVLDGVPLTLADGQTQLNVVDPAVVSGLEVVRGPASTFWGSGAGGVVAMSTAASGGPRVQVRALGGGYGTASALAVVRPDLEGGRLTAWGSVLDEDGYRDHGAARQARLGVSGETQWGGGEVSAVGLLAVVPRAESPGGITFEDAAQNPRQTRGITVERDASKALTQGHLALSWARPVAAGVLRATATGGVRTLDNPIVPRYIELDRRTAGLRVTLEGGASRVRWAAGLEGEGQRDERLESVNDAGQPGAVLTDQLETVTSGAVFGRLEVGLTSGLTASAAARADVLRYRAEPAGLEADGRTLGALSPSIGLAYRWRVLEGAAATVYANAAGALDAPTTTELGNRPDGSPGFDPSLDPERTWGGELGARVALAVPGGSLGLDVAAYGATVRDLLVPFEVDDVTFYRNEGQTRQVGLEVGVQPSLALAGGRLDGALAYGWTRARFSESAGALAVEGNEVPGVPEHLATWTLGWTGRGVTAGVSGEAASGYSADSANEAETEAYAVLHARLGLEVGRGAIRATPFVSVRNVLDEQYTGSVVVNAFGGRFAEPAAGRHVLAGVSLSIQ